MSLDSRAARVLDDALAIVRERRGLDFAEYRRATLERRLANRMMAARVQDAEAYLTLLRDAEDEVDHLAANFTVKVSRFYRNAAVFDFLRESVLPELRERFPREPLRAWSAGCAGGEEAYTLAMILDGEQDAVCATDIDETALAAARRGLYAAESFAEAGDGFARGLWQPAGQGQFSVSAVLRNRVEFVRHDLATAQFPPGAPFHLVSCRNVLIYFARPLQERVLRLLIDSLVPGGVLCLGEAEWPGRQTGTLEVLDRRRKIFRRVPGGEGSR